MNPKEIYPMQILMFFFISGVSSDGRWVSSDTWWVLCDTYHLYDTLPGFAILKAGHGMRMTASKSLLQQARG